MRLAAAFIRGHAAADVFAGEQAEMGVEFFAEVLVRAFLE
jgi:hypothetical protein